MSRLRDFHDQIEIHYSGFEATGVDKNPYSSIVVPLLLENVPRAITYNMIHFKSKNYMNWTLVKFIRTLWKELEVHESHVSIFKQESHGEKPMFQSKNSGV